MNKVILEGLVETEPDIRYFGYNHVRADFLLTTKEQFDNPADSSTPRQVSIKHNITAWGEVAQLIELKVRSGQTIYLEGRLTYDKKVSREGNVRVIPVVDCQNITILQDIERYAPPKASTSIETSSDIDWSAFAPTDDEDLMM